MVVVRVWPGLSPDHFLSLFGPGLSLYVPSASRHVTSSPQSYSMSHSPQELMGRGLHDCNLTRAELEQRRRPVLCKPVI